jgi:hypothetical protein
MYIGLRWLITVFKKWKIHDLDLYSWTTLTFQDVKDMFNKDMLALK